MPSDGIEAVLCFLGGYRGFYAQNTLPWTPKHSEKLTQHIDFKSSDITLLRFTFGGDGTLVSEVFEEIRRCGLKVTVAGIPKTIDNALQYFSCHVIDKSFDFGTVVEEANELLMQHTMKQKALIIVLVLSRSIAMYATLASCYVDCCLIPESQLYLEGTFFKVAKHGYKTEIYSAILVDMAGYTGFTVGPVNGKHAYIPIHVVFMLISLGADL
ncbi:hypothetical protein Q3G72_029376 [Acer saccharum]|nr:hypothetical protein Q3G72_029376 [Acer saccharum]